LGTIKTTQVLRGRHRRERVELDWNRERMKRRQTNRIDSTVDFSLTFDWIEIAIRPCFPSSITLFWFVFSLVVLCPPPLTFEFCRVCAVLLLVCFAPVLFAFMRVSPFRLAFMRVLNGRKHANVHNNHTATNIQSVIHFHLVNLA